jgi:WD40 repeat protein
MPDASLAAGLETFTRHRGPVTCVAPLPGRAAAVTGAYDGAVALFDLDAVQVALLGYHRHLVNHVAVNAGGTLAASSSSDYDIYLWDIPGHRLTRVLRGHADDVECFAFADDSTGVSASRDRRIIVWDLQTGAIRRVIEGHEKDVLSVTCRDGLIYSAGDDMTLRQWDMTSGALLRTWGPFETETDSCAIDVLNHRAILGCDDGVVRVFDSRDGQPLATIPAHASGIKKVAVSPINGDILSCAYDQRIRIWDARDFSAKVELDPHAAKWERSFGWAPDGATIMAGTFDGTVLRWDAATGRLIGRLGDGVDAASGSPGNVCFNEPASAEDGSVALVADDGLLRLARLTATESRLLETRTPPSGRVLMNAVTRDGAGGRILTGAHDHRLHVFHPDGTASALALGQGPINSIRVASHPGHEGAAFVACYSGAIVRVAADGDSFTAYPLHDGAVKALRLHPSEPVGVSCSADGGLLTWTLAGQALHSFAGHTAIVDDVDFSPSGAQIASTSRDFTVHVYRSDSGLLTHAIDLGRRSPKSLCFWDENTVVVGDYWGALLRIDLETGRLTRSTIAANGISGLSRVADGLIATSYDGGVYLVDVPSLTVRNSYRAMRQKLAAPAVDL